MTGQDKGDPLLQVTA